MRQFLCGAFPDDTGRLVVTDRNYRYLVKVLRFSAGDTLDARLPDGQLVTLYVEKIMPSTAVLRLVTSGGKTAQGVQASEVQSLAERTPEIWLFQFLPKPQKMDLIVRQATECGVRRIVPIAGEYSVKNDAAGRMERWERIIREARQQSGSGIATEITDVMAVGAAAELWKSFSAGVTNCGMSAQTCVSATTCAFLLDENPSAGKSSLTRIEKRGVAAAALAVGCEGGISANERDVLAEAGFMPLHFTTNVLRAETAAIYGIAVIQQFLSAD